MLDMFFMAEQLRSEHPNHFQTLIRVPATFQKIHYDRSATVLIRESSVGLFSVNV